MGGTLLNLLSLLVISRSKLIKSIIYMYEKNSLVWSKQIDGKVSCHKDANKIQFYKKTIFYLLYKKGKLPFPLTSAQGQSGNLDLKSVSIYRNIPKIKSVDKF